MSLFNPADILAGLIKNLGIQPADIQKVVATIDRMQIVAGEVEGFKQGFIAAMQHFSARLDAQDVLLARIAELLPPPSQKGLIDVRNVYYPNGHDRNIGPDGKPV